MISEVECVKRERAAFRSGAAELYGSRAVKAGNESFDAYYKVTEMADSRYPLPKVARPRVVKDPHSVSDAEWRVIDGEPEYRSRKHLDGPYRAWSKYEGGIPFTSDRVRIIADLLNNPTELVEVGLADVE